VRNQDLVGSSANAVKTQVWTALIAMLLLRFLQLRARFGWALSNLLALLRQQLFVHRDLWTWLDDPFQPPPPPAEQQLQLRSGVNETAELRHPRLSHATTAKVPP
jgi:hypothetical protein